MMWFIFFFLNGVFYNVFVYFAFLCLCISKILDEEWVYHNVLLLNCFGSCIVQRKALVHVQANYGGRVTEHPDNRVLRCIGAFGCGVVADGKSHAVTPYNIAGTRFDQMGTKMYQVFRIKIAAWALVQNLSVFRTTFS